MEGRASSDWKESATVIIWKKNLLPYSNYCPIRLFSYTMKTFGRNFDNHIRDIVEIRVHQAAFVYNCGTTDAIYAA